MSINAEILTLGQGFNLRTGEQTNYLIFQLPDGSQHKALINEDTATGLVKLFVARGGLPNPSPHAPLPEPDIRPGFAAGYTDEGAPAQVFGGGPPSPPPAPPPVAIAGPVASAMPRARLVGKDEAGNPIMEYPGGVHIPMPNGARSSVDEDGVAQA